MLKGQRGEKITDGLVRANNNYYQKDFQKRDTRRTEFLLLHPLNETFQPAGLMPSLAETVKTSS